jgi:tetratricopeptide (TPR) repeat protein
MAYNNIAWSKFNLKKYKDALVDANKAIELDNRNQVAYDTRAEIKFNLNDYNGCITDADIALSIDSKIANVYFLKGRASYRLGKKQDACKFWSKAGELGKAEAYEYITKYCNK